LGRFGSYRRKGERSVLLVVAVREEWFSLRSKGVIRLHADEPERRGVASVDVGADLRPLLPDHQPRAAVRTDPVAAEGGFPVGQVRAHELRIAGRAERKVEAVEQPVEVVEQWPLARRVAEPGRWLPASK
jgi:hypothetical protein